MTKLLDNMMKIVVENAGAQTGVFILEKQGKLFIEASVDVGNDKYFVRNSIPIESSHTLPLSIINYAARTRKILLLRDASTEGIFTNDVYFKTKQPYSIFCIPIVNQGKFIGLLYLENNLIKDAFTPERLEILKILFSQIAISLDNALLLDNLTIAKTELENYSRTLELKVEERTQELTKAKEAADVANQS
ncbi:MAG: GAF domain-containing protein [Calothrix sp. SM1_7_51]|nr:GAF domain-containing protein [Calothrix sp. SM1_7_51]